MWASVCAWVCLCVFLWVCVRMTQLSVNVPSTLPKRVLITKMFSVEHCNYSWPANTKHIFVNVDGRNRSCCFQHNLIAQTMPIFVLVLNAGCVVVRRKACLSLSNIYPNFYYLFQSKNKRIGKKNTSLTTHSTMSSLLN